ncbi:unnamed protein product [Urochloa humidicola]
MARRAPFPIPGPPPPPFDVRDTEQLVSYVSSCLPDPPVSTTARLSARRGASSPDGPDRISGLSDALLCDIVSRLPFKDAARTAVLATRWRRVWLEAPLAVADAHLLDHWPPVAADAPAVTAAVSSALAAHPGPFRCVHLVFRPTSPSSGDGSASSPPRASRSSSSSTAQARGSCPSPTRSSASPPSHASTSASGNSPTRRASKAPPSPTSASSASAASP